MADTDAMESCVYSLFQTDAPDVPSVFGGTEHVNVFPTLAGVIAG
jgi:hypothetical protein